MKINEVIRAADSIAKNAFSLSEKAFPIQRLEERLRKEFNDEEIVLSYPEDEEKELFLPSRYTEIYIYCLVAMIFFWQKDYAEYNNNIALYTSMLEDFRRETAQQNAKTPSHFKNLFG